MAWSTEKNIGSWGTLYLEVDRNSYSQSGNTSSLKVVAKIKNRGTSRAHQGAAVSWSVGGGSISDSGTFTLDVAAGATSTIHSANYTVSHNSDGTKSLTVSFTMGGTSTSTFESGGTVSVAFTLPRIPKATTAPGTPTASVINQDQINLAWSAPSNTNGAGVSRYQIDRSTTSNFSSNVSTSYTTATSAGQYSLANGTLFYFRIRAENVAGWSAWSGTRSATTYDVPDKPATPTIGSTTSTSFTVDWVQPSGNGITPTYMRIQVSEFSDFRSYIADYDDNASPAGPSGLTRATTYYLRIKSKNAAGYGPVSNTVTVKTDATAPDKMSVPKITNVVQTTATGTGSAPNNGGSSITKYQYRVGLNSAFTGTVKTFEESGTSVNFTGLTPGTTYYVQVRAVNDMGAGEYSGFAIFTTLTGVRVKVAGTYVWAVANVKAAGTYRQAVTWKKVAGVWRMD